MRLVRAAFDILLRMGPLGLIQRLDHWIRKGRYRRRNTHPVARLVAAQQNDRRRLRRVVYVAGTSELLSRRYRVDNVCEQLEKQGITCQTILDVDAYRRAREVLRADAIVFQRVCATPEMLELARIAHEQNIPVAFDMDDLLFEAQIGAANPPFSDLPVEEQYLFEQLVAGYREMLLNCEHFIGSTQFLADRAKDLGRRPHVIRNGLSDRFIEIADAALRRRHAQRPQPVIRIGYLSGTQTHRHDFDLVVTPLVGLMALYPQVQLVICGYLELPSAFAPFSARIKHHSFMNWERLIQLTATLDINIAPLDITNDFNLGKSALKYFEAAIVRVPTIASPVEDFQVAIRHMENGLIAANTHEWFACLQLLIEQSAVRTGLGAQAHRAASQYYTATAQSAHTRAVFESIFLMRKVDSNKEPTI